MSNETDAVQSVNEIIAGKDAEIVRLNEIIGDANLTIQEDRIIEKNLRARLKSAEGERDDLREWRRIC